MSREVYPSAPLRLVALELRYPFAPRLGSQDVLEELTRRFRPDFPLPEAPGVQLLMSVGVSQQSAGPSANRFLSKDRTASVTITPANMVIETTSYTEYSAFRPLVETCLQALGQVADGIVGIERLGLRFINEIRVPGIEDARHWAEYLAPNLVSPLEIISDKRIGLMQSVVQTETVSGMNTTLRFGALRGQVVGSTGPLKVNAVPVDSPFFLLDIDTSWSSSETFDDFSSERTLELCDQLHGPIDMLFEDSVTDKLRELLRKVE